MPRDAFIPIFVYLNDVIIKKNTWLVLQKLAITHFGMGQTDNFPTPVFMLMYILVCQVLERRKPYLKRLFIALKWEGFS